MKYPCKDCEKRNVCTKKDCEKRNEYKKERKKNIKYNKKKFLENKSVIISFLPYLLYIYLILLRTLL